MEVSIIISGTLTGFSQFYASPNASASYDLAKFDFDYRNYVTFLHDGESAYAISFSPKVIAVSRIVRILDSFRRPGVLVISALIPRNQLVNGTLSSSDKAAVYKLLNEVYERFRERNFVKDMVNQNPSVLMQDHYSDILSHFTLVSDRMQKPVNETIDITTPNKKIGYVASTEQSMPKYLASLMRKSYEGYHHVFFAENAPQNIDEPAEEIITYKVRVENGRRPVPGEVRLTDRIPNIQPEQGEKDLPNKNFTYAQVLNGEAGNTIMASIEGGETIVLSFRFPQEEKTITFRFYEGSNPVPLQMVRPYIDGNGAHISLPSETYTFIGKEIYGPKTIHSGNHEYTVVGAGLHLDLQRLRNDSVFNVNVERGWTWQFEPMRNNRPMKIDPVNITLTNRLTGEKKLFHNVTSAISERLTGHKSDWDLLIESDYYETVNVPVGTNYELKPKSVRPAVVSGAAGRTANATVHGNNRTVSTKPNNKTGVTITGRDNSADNEQVLRDRRRKQYLTYGAMGLAGCLIVAGVIWLCVSLFGGDATKPNPDDNSELVADNTDTEETKVTKTFEFVICDASDTHDAISNETMKRLTVAVSPNNETEIKNPTNPYPYKVTFTPEKDAKVVVNVSLDGIELFKETASLDNLKDCDIILNVKESEIKYYLNLVGPNGAEYVKNERNYNNITNAITNLKDRNLALATRLLDLTKAYYTPTEPPKSEAKRGPEVGGTIKAVFEQITSTYDDVNSTEAVTPQEKTRKAALLAVLKDITDGKCPQSAAGLSPAQQRIVKKLIELNKKINDVKDRTEKAKLQRDFQRGLCTNPQGKFVTGATAKAQLSLNTAQTALKVKVPEEREDSYEEDN